MPRVLNKPRFWRWHDFVCKVYAEFRICMIMASYASIIPENASVCLNVPQCAWIWLIIVEWPWICLKIPEYGVVSNLYQILILWSKFLDTSILNTKIIIWNFRACSKYNSLLIQTIYKTGMTLLLCWRLYWGYILINRVYSGWYHESCCVTFPKNTGVQTFHFKLQLPQTLWSWSLDVLDLVKGHYAICRPE